MIVPSMDSWATLAPGPADERERAAGRPSADAESLASLIESDPFIGVLEVDAKNRISFADQAAAEMLLAGDAIDFLHAPLSRHSSPRFTAAIEQRLVPGESRVLRAIVRGWQTIITARGHDDDSGYCLVIQRRAGIIPPFLSGFEIGFLNCGSLGPLNALSAREIEVAAWIGLGLSVRRIAERLHRSVKTIENHRVAIGKKLGISDRLDIALLAFQAGLRPEDVKLERL